MKKNILIILGHPNTDSFCNAIGEAYYDGVKECDTQVTYVRLSELSFDPILHKGYTEIQQLEDDLVILQNKIQEADHIVFVYPTWWGAPPALLKGLIDRILLPGFGFRFRKDSILWDRLLKGRSARIITTMDEPSFYYRLGFGAPGDKMMKRVILTFCGISPVHITHIDRVRFKTDSQRKKILEKVKNIALKDCRR